MIGEPHRIAAVAFKDQPIDLYQQHPTIRPDTPAQPQCPFVWKSGKRPGGASVLGRRRRHGGAPGTRPWAWWWLEEHPPIGDDESGDEYLTRTKQWLPGERKLFEAAKRVREPDDDDADLTPR